MQNKNDNTLRCRQCGECCRTGGPALHEQDLNLVREGIIPLADLVTLRKGEMAYDQPANRMVALDDEMIKIKGSSGVWTCRYFSPGSKLCTIYENRPSECEALFCEDIEPLRAMYREGRINRGDILPAGHPLLELIREHDLRCDAARMASLAKAAREGVHQAGADLKEMVVFDREVRRMVPEKSGMDPELNEFLFGRSLRVLLAAMNIKVYEAGGTLRFNFGNEETHQ